jgi:hypothetical protein
MAFMKSSLLLLAAMLFAGVQPISSALSVPYASKISGAVPQSTRSTGLHGKSIIIRLEQKNGNQVLEMSPHHVFDAGDIVRFRLTSEFDGYLYVVNLGSTGAYSPLFPAPGTKRDNRINKGVDSLVPSTEDGWFQIDGPAGFDVLYILVSSAPIDVSADTGAKGNGGPSHSFELPGDSLKPRCNDAIFQARGECVDESAGPAPLARDAPLPPQIGLATRNVSRDIIFVPGDDEKSVEVSAPSTTPVVYIFRLAHR